MKTAAAKWPIPLLLGLLVFPLNLFAIDPVQTTTTTLPTVPAIDTSGQTSPQTTTTTSYAATTDLTPIQRQDKLRTINFSLITSIISFIKADKGFNSVDAGLIKKLNAGTLTGAEAVTYLQLLRAYRDEAAKALEQFKQALAKWKEIGGNPNEMDAGILNWLKELGLNPNDPDVLDQAVAAMQKKLDGMNKRIKDLEDTLPKKFPANFPELKAMPPGIISIIGSIDANGNPVVTIKAVDGSTTVITYNKDGLPTSMVVTDAQGNKLEVTFNADGTQTVSYNGKPLPGKTVTKPDPLF